MWTVVIKKKVSKGIPKLPQAVEETVKALIKDLTTFGPNPGKKWKNYSKLQGEKHHCHISYSYVVCWEVINKKISLMEIYYVGSRENAPY